MDIALIENNMINEKIKFSLIVPVYNVEEYVCECIDSLLIQTYTNMEIILIDDGSTDDSGKICDKYREEHEKVMVYHKQNGGLSDARNYGISKATGDYLCFVDSDDYVASDMLENYAYFINIYGYADVLIENGQFTFYDNGNIVETIKIPEECEDRYSGEDAFDLMVKCNPPIWAAFGKAFKREFWNSNGLSFRKGILSEDIDMVYKAFYLSESAIIMGKHSYYYRFGRPGSIMSSRSNNMVNSMLAIFDGWEEFMVEHSFSAYRIELIRKLLAQQYYMLVMSYIPRMSDIEWKIIKKKFMGYSYYMDLINSTNKMILNVFGRKSSSILCRINKNK